MQHQQQHQRLDYLDAVRAFALLLGIVFHASLSFSPIFIGWAVMDISTSPSILSFITICHSFRMELFFLIAGFFSHMSFHRNGIGSFLKSRLTRIAIPFFICWFILRPLIVSGWIMGAASLRGSVDILAGLKGGFQSLESLPAGIFTGTHLWFLYYMMLVTGIALITRQLITLIPSLHLRISNFCDSITTWLANSRASVFLLSLPTAVLIWNMSTGGMDTPDKTLIPQLPVLAVYGGFYTLGWILHRNGDTISRFARITVLSIATTLISIVALLFLSKFQQQPSHPQYQIIQFAYALCYALTMGSLVWMTIGLFMRICHKPNKIIRYIADSSYWLYLIHLPIVVWFQVAFAELPFHWTLKLAAISILTIGFSLLLYDLLVRSTIIGKILNGRKRERVIFRHSQHAGKNANA